MKVYIENLPEKLKNRKYYSPKNNSYEKNLEKVDKERRNKNWIQQ